ncbi:hypothetical protein SprV_0301140600 [Sparganum proliferum]
MDAPSYLPQHGVNAEDSGASQDFRVRGPVQQSQPQYCVKTIDVEVIELPGMTCADGPCPRSVKTCCHDELNAVAIPHGGLQPAECLADFGEPTGNLVARACAS